MTPTTTDTGRRGEDIAAAHLEALGFLVLERNYRYERAEVDLVCFLPTPANDGGEMVFVEVKTRSGTGFGTGEEAVTAAKQRLLWKAATAYLFERKLEGAPARFDVVCVQLHARTVPTVVHHEHAFGLFF